MTSFRFKGTMNNFNFVAELQVRANTQSLNQTVQGIQRSLKNVSASINLTGAEKTLSQLDSLQRQLNKVNHTLENMARNSAIAAAAITSIGGAFGGLSSAASKAGGFIRVYTRGVQDASIAAHEASQGIEKFASQAGLAARRFLSFGVIAVPIIAVTRAIKESIVEGISFERQMNKIAQVSGESKQQVAAVGDEVTRLAVNFGVSSKELVGAALVFKQAGLSLRETQAALEAVAKAALAPNFDSMSQTADVAIAIMKQFKVEAADLGGALSSVNAVAGDFAVEAKDLTEVIKRAGGAFTQTGGNLNELLALFTSVRATTRESAEEISTGLRTIFTRIQRGDTVESLKQLGINLRYTAQESKNLGDAGLENQFVGAYEAVRRLSGALSGLRTTDSRYTSILESLGGYRQIDKVIPLIQQFRESQRALNVAQQAGLSLTLAADKAQESMAVRIEKVKEQFLALGRTILDSKGFQAAVDGMLKLASALGKVLDFARPLIPLLATLATAKIFTSIGRISPPFLGQLTGTASPRPFASGGRVGGSGNHDSVPAMLTPDEFVVNKRAARSIGYDRLYDANRSPEHYATGGVVSRLLQAPSDLTGRLISRLPKKVQTVVKAPFASYLAAQNLAGDVGQSQGMSPEQVKTLRVSLAGGDILGGKATFVALKSVGLPSLAAYAGSAIPLASTTYLARRPRATAGVLSDRVRGLFDGVPSHYAVGGTVPGVGNDDRVPSLLTPGEFVIRKDSAQKLGADRLHYMNRSGKLPGYNRGGFARLNTGGFSEGGRDEATATGYLAKQLAEDPDLFTKIVKTLQKKQYEGYFKGIKQEPEDFASNALIKASTTHDPEGGASFKTYATRAALNSLRSEYRSLKTADYRAPERAGGLSGDEVARQSSGDNVTMKDVTEALKARAARVSPKLAEAAEVRGEFSPYPYEQQRKTQANLSGTGPVVSSKGFVTSQDEQEADAAAKQRYAAKLPAAALAHIPTTAVDNSIQGALARLVASLEGAAGRLKEAFARTSQVIDAEYTVKDAPRQIGHRPTAGLLGHNPLADVAGTSHYHVPVTESPDANEAMRKRRVENTAISRLYASGAVLRGQRQRATDRNFEGDDLAVRASLRAQGVPLSQIVSPQLEIYKRLKAQQEKAYAEGKLTPETIQNQEIQKVTADDADKRARRDAAKASPIDPLALKAMILAESRDPTATKLEPEVQNRLLAIAKKGGLSPASLETVRKEFGVRQPRTRDGSPIDPESLLRQVVGSVQGRQGYNEKDIGDSIIDNGSLLQRLNPFYRRRVRRDVSAGFNNPTLGPDDFGTLKKQHDDGDKFIRDGGKEGDYYSPEEALQRLGFGPAVQRTPQPGVFGRVRQGFGAVGRGFSAARGGFSRLRDSYRAAYQRGSDSLGAGGSSAIYGGLIAGSFLGDSVAGGGSASDAVTTSGTGVFHARRAVGGAISTAAIGAGIGNSFLPGWGAAIGAGVGAVYGFASSLKEASKEIQEVKIANALTEFSEEIQRFASGKSGKTAEAFAKLNKESGARDQSESTGYLSGLDIAAYLERRKKSVREQIIPQAPNIQRGFDTQIQDLAKRKPTASATSLYSQFQGGVNGQLIEKLALARGTTSTEIGQDLTKQIAQAQRQVLIERQAGQSRRGEERNVNTFGRLVLAIQAAADSLTGLREKTQLLQETFDGVIGSSKVTAHTDNLNGFGRNDRAALEPLRLIAGVGGEGGASLLRGGQAADALSSVLPSVLASVAARGSLSGDEFGVATRKGLTGALANQGVSVTPEIQTGIETILHQLNEVSKGGPSKILEQLQNDGTKFSEQLMAPLVDAVKKAGSEAGKSLETEANNFIGGLATFRKQVTSIGESFDKVNNLRLSALRNRVVTQAENNFQGKSALRGLSLETLNAPLQLRQERLTQVGGAFANDPELIGGALRQVNAAIPGAAANKQKIFETPGGAKSQAFVDATIWLEHLRGRSLALGTALDNLTKVAERTASAQEQLNAIESNRQGRLGLAERYATADPEERQKLDQGAILANHAYNNPKAIDQYTPEQVRLVSGFYNAAGGSVLTGFNGSPVASDAKEKFFSGFQGGRFQLDANDKQQRGVLQGKVQVEHDKAAKAAEEQLKTQKVTSAAFFATLNQTLKEFFQTLARQLTVNKGAEKQNQLTQNSIEKGKLEDRKKERDLLQTYGVKSTADLDRFKKVLPDIEKLSQGKAESANAYKSISKFTDPKQVDDVLARIFPEPLDAKHKGVTIQQYATSHIGPTPALKGVSARLAESLADSNLSPDVIKNIVEKFNKSGGTLLSSFSHKDDDIQGFVRGQLGPLLSKTVNEEAHPFIGEKENKAVKDARKNIIGAGFQLGPIQNEVVKSGNTSAISKAAESFNSTAGTIEDLEEAVRKNTDEFKRLNAPTTAEAHAAGGSIFKPKGTDTVPAMLTPGEYVVNQRSAQANLSLLSKINSAKGPLYRADGGDAAASDIEEYRKKEAERSASRQQAMAEYRKRADDHKYENTTPYGDSLIVRGRSEAPTAIAGSGSAGSTGNGITFEQYQNRVPGGENTAGKGQGIGLSVPSAPRRRVVAQPQVVDNGPDAVLNRALALEATINPGGASGSIVASRMAEARLRQQYAAADKRINGLLNGPDRDISRSAKSERHDRGLAWEQKFPNFYDTLGQGGANEALRNFERENKEDRKADSRKKYIAKLRDWQANIDKQGGLAAVRNNYIQSASQQAAFGSQIASSISNFNQRSSLANAQDSGNAFGAGRGDFGGNFGLAGNSLQQLSNANAAQHRRDDPNYSKLRSPFAQAQTVNIPFTAFRGVDPRRFATGGHVGDTVPAMLTPGEFVMNRGAVARVGAKNLQHFNRGGIVGSQYLADGGTAQGGGTESFNKLTASLSEFTGHSTQLAQALTAFGTHSSQLADALAKMPQKVTLQGEHTVNVNHNGVEIFAKMTPAIQEMVVQQVNTAIQQAFKDRLPDAGITV